ncbi:MAG TPA: endonuclease/exonuclease/phosphatase family protein [Iamia sp.]
MGETPAVHRPFTSILAVVVLLLLGVACSDDGDGAQARPATEEEDNGPDVQLGTFEVLTYNVAGLPQEVSEEMPSVNIPKISPLLEPYDVVLTQEDFDWWPAGGLIDANDLDAQNYHERLRADTTHEFATPEHPGPEAAGIDPADRPTMEIGDGIGILSRFPLDGFEVRAWTGCFGSLDTSDGGAADCASIKGFRVATMDLDGAPVDVYSLHGEAGGTDEDQALQADDFAELAAFIAEHSEGRAVIVGGDTNLHTDPSHPDAEGEADTEIWDAFLAEVGLTDSCTETDCRETGRIDKVAYRSSDDVTLAATEYELPEGFVDEAGEQLSDHEPVAVTFSWEPAAG